MDGYSLEEWLIAHKIPVGDWAEAGVDWLKTYGRAFFDRLSDGLDWMIDGIVWCLQTPPMFLIILLFVGLTWVLQKSWAVCLLVLVCLLFVVNQGYWEETTDSLALVLSSCVVCMGFGVPLGIFFAHRPKLYQTFSPVLDLMQTLPAFVYLIPAIVFFGLGMVPGLFATVIFVLPAPIRLTYLGVSNTPTALLEAAESFGATPAQRLWKVELPYAVPQIMAGLNQVIMLSLSMVVISAYVGANGLGKPVVQALGRNDPGLGFESGFVIVAVAIMLDRMLRVKSK
ncbi:glycine betaine/proline transport system permease protein [Yoonia tamlensis]|uniref:Glycine betaine/proline transport system permease protein n=1 Tax=Yoonia tamlensis TaxID=390270 RepID=A0A1I6FWS3_9RHOB|nr:choline ABC transporter permease subunit [Yoonia tamlensis]SFR34425.1 glycine betaine/proline transport system permease protein [Yoonia tamlensis]